MDAHDTPDWSAAMLRLLVPKGQQVPVFGSPAWRALDPEDPLRMAAAIVAARRWLDGVEAATEELAAELDAAGELLPELFERALRLAGARRHAGLPAVLR